MASSKMAGVGGYDVVLTTVIPKKYQCPFCKLIMRDPIQTYRGEMSCESCYVDAKGNEKICPIDLEPIEDGEFFRDVYARRQVLQLDCYCSYKKNGCTWEGVINEIEAHSANCIYKEISCTKCHDFILRKYMDQHEKDLCRFRMVQCPYCTEIYDGQTLQSHEPTCHLKPVECPYLCGQHISLNLLYSHVGSCPKVLKENTCPYQIVGCEYQSRNSADLKDHLQAASNVHAAYSVALVKSLQQSNEKMKQDLLTEQTLRNELARKVEAQENDKSILATEIEKIHAQLYNVQKECTTLQERCDFSVAKVKEDLKEVDLRIQQNSLQDIDNTLTEIYSKYNEFEAKLNSGIQGTSSAGGNIDSREVKDGIEKISHLEGGSAILTANLSDLELKLQLLENTCYEGRQLWKVDNVAYRMTQAITGKVTVLHSAPCFHKRGSYKFCSRLYLNGDGMGRGTHVSLFFVLMKSDYDALLSWPFAEQVTFRLINPNNVDESVVESFVPDKNSSSFKRPTKDMNIAAGCPMFIKKEMLQRFIVDDAFYIESMIGTATIH